MKAQLTLGWIPRESLLALKAELADVYPELAKSEIMLDTVRPR